MSLKLQMKKGEQTREKMVDEAIRLMAKHGFHDTSFQKIADGCDMSQSACLKHFPTKMHLARAVMEKIIRGNHSYVSKTFDAKDDAVTRLTKHFEGNLKWAVALPAHAQITVLLYYLASFDETLRDLYLNLAHGARERVRELVFAGQREKGISTTSPEELSITLYDLLLGSFVAFVAAGKSEKEIRPYVKRWRLLFAGE